MLYEVVKNNFFAEGFAQIIVSIDESIEEPKSLSVIDRVKQMFRTYYGTVVEVKYGEYEEKKVKIKYNEIIRQVEQDNDTKSGKRLPGPEPQVEETWELSREFGWVLVGILGSTIDYLVVEVLKPNNSRVALGTVFYISTKDLRHFYKRIGSYAPINTIEGYRVRFHGKYPNEP